MGRLDPGLLQMGLISLQIISSCAGAYSGICPIAVISVLIFQRWVTPWMPVFLWVFLCGLSHLAASCRGVYEQRFPIRRVLASGAFRSFCIWGDVLHHCRDGVFSFLHVMSLVAMSYSHHPVKEGASQLVDDIRIQNILTISSRRFLPGERSLRLLLFCRCIVHFGVGLRAIAAAPPYEYDMTMGYPGEGPRWAMISANIDSLATNDNCLHWEADVLALQEARVAESNLIESQRKAALCHFQLFCSQPLQKVRASNGTYRIPSGGTATFGRKEFTQLFDDQADHSGQWALLRSTTRVTATWHQVAEGVKLLAFNFYAIANAAS